MSRLASRRTAIAFALTASAALALPAFAQSGNYPNRPIKLVVPYGAGGGTDQMARLLSDKLQQRLGQPVVVDNKPGAGTVIGSEYAARQPADGYTLLLTTSGLTSARYMIANLPFDAVKDFTPIAPLSVMLISLSASNDVPASNVKELIAYMKANPNKLNYASYGVATTNNLAMSMFNKQAGISSMHVPYKAGTQALPDLVSGQVHLMFDSMQTSGPLVKAGKLKVLGLATSERSPLLPNAATVAESGLPGFKFEPWFGIFGPAGMPKPIVDRLNKEINAVMTEPALLEAMKQQFLTPHPGTADDMKELVRKDLVYWGEAAQAAGVKPE